LNKYKSTGAESSHIVIFVLMWGSKVRYRRHKSARSGS